MFEFINLDTPYEIVIQFLLGEKNRRLFSAFGSGLSDFRS